MVTIMTDQRICLLGMLTEAIHTPFMSDRAISIDNARYIFNTMADLGSEISFKEDGIIMSRAKEVLERASGLLGEIEKRKLFGTLEEGIFAGIKRKQDAGKGLEGVVRKEEGYFNPFIDLMKGGGRK